MAKISKAYSKILVVLMAWLGFSCETENFENSKNIGPLMYGTPTATFKPKAKGVIISETDDIPIEGIRAVLKARWGTEGQFYYYGMDTVYTDSNGIFELKNERIVPAAFEKSIYVELSDVDGEENGSFTDMDIEADYSKETFTGGDGSWYQGEAEKNLGAIKMAPKE